MITLWMFDILLCLLSCTIGLGAGCLLFYRPEEPWYTGLWQGRSAGSHFGKLEASANKTGATVAAHRDPKPEIVELMTQLEALTDNVRTDVNAHSVTMKAINHDLIGAQGQQGTENVTKIISRLLEANQQLGNRLDLAENRLKEQAKLLRSERIEARTDPLTHLPNRRVFDEETTRLYDEWQRTNQPVSLMLLDIDHFKVFNDEYGHQAGDICLQQVGGILRRTLRGVGGIVSRYGGEEFGVLLPLSNFSDAKISAIRLTRAINQANIHFDGQSHRVTASIGLAEMMGGISQADWIKRADIALYAAKSNGRNRAYLHNGESCEPILEESQGKSKRAAATKAKPAASQPTEVTTNLPEMHPRYGRRQPEATQFVENLERRLGEFSRSKEPLCVVLVAIDPRSNETGDKQVPRQGHDAVQQILTAAVRNMDFVCRSYENQFAVLLPKADAAQISAVAKRIRRAVSNLSLKSENVEQRITISVGITEALGGDEGAHLIGRAEIALTHAQDRGGDMICLLANECDWERPAIIASPQLESVTR